MEKDDEENEATKRTIQPKVCLGRVTDWLAEWDEQQTRTKSGVRQIENHTMAWDFSMQWFAVEPKSSPSTGCV